MRHAIWEAEDFFLIGGKRIDMDPVVVECKEEPLAVVWQYRFDGPTDILGKISDICIENGAMTGEVEWLTDHMNDKLLEDFGCRIGGYYTNVVKASTGGHVLSCTLKATSVMFLHATPGFPKRNE